MLTIYYKFRKNFKILFKFKLTMKLNINYTVHKDSSVFIYILIKLKVNYRDFSLPFLCLSYTLAINVLLYILAVAQLILNCCIYYTM